MRALVIDDSRAMRSILSGILGDAGFEVVQVDGGKEALSILDEDNDFALALIDWNMPEMNGLDLVRAIRERHVGASIKLMMVTTETEIARVREALQSGADEYIMKPFDKVMLVEKLALLGIDAA
jgi:two-component system chemotaxis response regulator CheY